MAKLKPTTAHVICNGGSHANQQRDLEAGLDCNEFHALHPEGNSNCAFGCLGLSSCVDACPFDALFINADGVAEVDRDKCTDCGKCYKVCPKHIIISVPRINTINMVCASHDKPQVVKKACSTGCIACNKCEKACPAYAIHVVDNIASIDDDKCIACGMCAVVCPVDCISDVHGIYAVVSRTPDPRRN